MTSCFHFCSYGNHSSGHVLSILSNRQHQLKATTGRRDDQENQELDVMLSQAFNRLTFEERQEQQDLLHGVDDEVVEETDFVNKSLEELDEHLVRIKSGTMYEQAEMMDPMYVCSRSFRVMFLRGNRYDAKAAADQMIRFFKMKKRLFGTEKLVKNITIEDLDEDDRACLRTGCIQVACKDSAKRQVIFQVPGLRAYKNVQNELRARYFITMKVLENEEAQRRGAVAVAYMVGQYKDNKNGEGFADNHNLSMALPLHMAAFHACSTDWAQTALGNVVVSIMPAKQRARFRLHFGTHLECQYLLSTFGISGSLLPFVPETGSIDLEPHLQWCEKCFDGDVVNQLIAKPLQSGPITEPNPNDVLSLGSQKIDNAGNGRLRELVKDFAEGYKSGTNEDKRLIVDRIIGDIHGKGGRFLQQDKGSQTWKELSLSSVRLKITQRFRNHNRRRETPSLQARGTLFAGIPLPNDVLFGRAQRSKGNDFLHHLIKHRFEEYESLDRRMKVVVLDSIIECIKSEGGRFLQPTPGPEEQYVELSTDSIRERLSTYFRNYRRSCKKKST